jgi:hypothetical protein
VTEPEGVVEEFLGKAVKELIKNTPLALIFIGVSLAVFGATGGYDKIHVDGTWRIAVAVLGLVLSCFGGLVIWRGPLEGDDPLPYETFGLKFTSPKENTGVAQKIRIEGTYRKMPPKDSVAVLEMSPATNRYWFKRQRPVFENDEKWYVAGVYVSGRKDEDRILYLAMLGKSGKALRDYYLAVREQCPKPVGIDTLTKDVALCASVTVHRTADDPPSQTKDEDDYGLGIDMPVGGSVVGDRFRVEGTYKKRPPEDRVIVYEQTPDYLYWFKKPSPVFDEQRKRWSTEIYVGGTRSQNRDLFIATTGAAGKCLFDHFFFVYEQCEEWVGVRQLTPDIIPRDHVTVRYR